MQGNRQAYGEAYERTVAGKSPSLLDLVKRPFEDTYTRQSRLQGEKDGAEARASLVETPQAATE